MVDMIEIVGLPKEGGVTILISICSAGPMGSVSPVILVLIVLVLQGAENLPKGVPLV